MTWLKTLEQRVDDVLSTEWQERFGRVVPTTEDVVLKNAAVKLDATFLYADLAGSSELAKLCPWDTTAKIIRAYLDCCVRTIRVWDGEIRSFDGDRVMGIFVGDGKETKATYCAREIDYLVERVLGPKAKAKFRSVASNNIKLKHCVGIDTGIARAVRSGIRDNNDLIWIGRPPSFAAKMSDIRDYPRSVYISEDTYKMLEVDAKIDGSTYLWEKYNHTFAGKSEVVYATRYMRIP